MPVMDLISLSLRAIQILFAIILLGLTAYLVNFFNDKTVQGDSPSRVNFMLFNSLWTILVASYLLFAPRLSHPLNHKYAILGLDAVTCIFWFAGFIALAVLYHDLIFCVGHICSVMVASAVFGAFEW